MIDEPEDLEGDVDEESNEPQCGDPVYNSAGEQEGFIEEMIEEDDEGYLCSVRATAAEDAEVSEQTVIWEEHKARWVIV